MFNIELAQAEKGGAKDASTGAFRNTTAGMVRESVFDEMYELACKIADGVEEDPTFLPILYELDSRDEWTDPTKWQKANPGLGTIKQYKTLAAFVQRAKIKPEDLPGVLCKDFNIREVSAAVWLSFEAIQSELRFELQDVYNTYALGGCDLSATTDLTCVSPGDRWRGSARPCPF